MQEIKAMMRRMCFLLPCFLVLQMLSCAALAEDVYVLASSGPQKVPYETHSRQLLLAALEVTKPEYGPYVLKVSGIPMLHLRQLRELQEGQLVNISAQITTPEWEKTLLPVRIPIDKGINGFRISLIDGRRQAELARVTTLEQLRQLAVGVGEQWATHEVYVENGLRVVAGNSDSGLYGMLMAGRFDYLPRSMEQALHEEGGLAADYPHLAIEKSFALYAPLPRYYFVSPKTPRLAERLTTGIEKLIASGEYDRSFAKFYAPLISQIGLCRRAIIRLENTTLSLQTPFKRGNLWFDPFNSADRELACGPTHAAAKKSTLQQK